MAQREARADAGAADKEEAAGGGRMMTGVPGHVALEMGGGVGELRAEQRATATTTTWACGAGVAAVGLAGAAVLVWWALAFHPEHQQLWMVPVGLVLLGTPLLTWLSLFASGACRWLGRLRDHQPPLVRPAPDPER